MGKKRTKNEKSNSRVTNRQHTEPHFNISSEVYNSDSSRTNQSLDSTRSVENVSDSLESVSLHDYENTVPLNDSSFVEQENSSRNCSQKNQKQSSDCYRSSCSKYKTDCPSINNLESIIEPIAGSSEVIELQKEDNSTKMLNVNAEAFIPKQIQVHDSTDRDSGFPLNNQNKFRNDVDIPIPTSNEVSRTGSTHFVWGVSSPLVLSNKQLERDGQKRDNYNKDKRNVNKSSRDHNGQFDKKPHIHAEVNTKSNDGAANSSGSNTSTYLEGELNRGNYIDNQSSSYSNYQNNSTSNLCKGNNRRNYSEQRHAFNRNDNKSYKENNNRLSDERWSSTQDMNNCSRQQSKKKYLDPRFERDRQSRNFTDNADKESDEELQQFKREYKQIKNEVFVKVVERDQDLFAMPKDYALAHCVAEDMRMGSGIAVQFRRDFKKVDELLQQHAKEGSLATLNITTDTDDKRYIYYLVTKKLSNGKPTYETFWSSLKKMRNHVRDNNVKKLAMPRIGCGLDRLDWSEVSHMIEFLFKNVDVDIVICNLIQSEDYPSREHSSIDYSCKIVRRNMSVADIDPQTLIIYLTSEDGHVSDDMKKLAEKFSFKYNFQRAQKRLGECIKFKQTEYSLYGCVVRKTTKSEFDYISFKQCLVEINKDNKKDLFNYVAMQEIKDENDPIINEKLITIMRYYLRNVEIHFCGNGDISDQTPPRRQEKRASVTAYDMQRSSNQTSDLSKTQNDYDPEKPHIDKEEHSVMSYASATNSSSNITLDDQIWNDTSYSKGDDEYKGDNSASIDHNKSSREHYWNRSDDSRRSSNQSSMNNSINQSTKIYSDHSFDGDMRSTEEEYQQFDRQYKPNKDEKFIKVIERDQDLFAMPKDYSLAHCVAADMSMGSGIAVQFKTDFKRVDELLQQKAKQGGVAILNDNDDRYIYYLVTKKNSTGKPIYYTIFSSLRNMRNHVRDNNVKKLAMPRIGCGLDRLEWSRVKLMIEFLFKDVDIEIVICNFQQNYGKTKQKPRVTTVKSKKDKKRKKKK